MHSNFKLQRSAFIFFRPLLSHPVNPLTFLLNTFMFRETWSAEIFRDNEKFCIFSNNIHRSGGNYQPLSPTLTSLDYWFSIYHPSWLIKGPKITLHPTLHWQNGQKFSLTDGCSTMPITSKVTNPNAWKIVFTCVVYPKFHSGLSSMLHSDWLS